jgi:hypothetical protein
MEKFIKYLILMILLSKKSISYKCINNFCECNELKDELRCTNNNNKESIDLILNEFIFYLLFNKGHFDQ